MTVPPTLCLDSNVLLTLRYQQPGAASVAAYLNRVGQLVVCGPVVAELMPREPAAEAWLTSYGVEVDWVLGRAVWQRVGLAHSTYVQRRRASGGGLPRRILTDHLIGAHAEVNGLPLMTLNEADYLDFTALHVITP